jgi:hypothetical protein
LGRISLSYPVIHEIPVVWELRWHGGEPPFLIETTDRLAGEWGTDGILRWTRSVSLSIDRRERYARIIAGPQCLTEIPAIR